MIDDDVDDVDVTYSQETSGGVQIRVNTTCRNYGGVRTPRTPMDRRHCYDRRERVSLSLMAHIGCVLVNQ